MQKPRRASRKITLSNVKIKMYFFLPSGWLREYSENVIRLASDAISVPVPPIFTPKSNEL